MNLIAKTWLSGALIFAVSYGAHAQWIRPDASVTFRAGFETQPELLEFLAAYFVKQQRYQALQRKGEPPGTPPLIFRTTQGKDIVARGVAQPGNLICIVVDFYYQPRLESDVRKRDQELLASAKEALHRSRRGYAVRALSPCNRRIQTI